MATIKDLDMDFASLTTLRKVHPAWRLLMADHAPLITSFFTPAGRFPRAPANAGFEI